MENIRDLMQTSRMNEMTAWFEYLDGFRVCLEYVNKKELQDMVRKSTRMEWDDSHRQVERINEDVFIKKLSAKIRDWEGLTPEVLGRLLPVDVSKIDVAEIPCNPENKIQILKNAYGFDDFVQERVTSLSRIREGQHEAALKNSETSHSQD